MNSIVQFPLIGLYREDAEMGRYLIDDDECDALELAPVEATTLYMNLRRRMDFATGIVGGKKRRISWLEITQWLHRDSARGRKAVTVSISKARRLVGQMVKLGLLEYRTDRQTDFLMFYLPLACSDASEALKKAADEAAYQQAVDAAIAESENCVSMNRFRQRDGTTGTFLPDLVDALELPAPSDMRPLPVTQTPENRLRNAENTRQTFDSPTAAQADSPVGSVTTGFNGPLKPINPETRQTIDRDSEAKADNNSPFTPIHNIESTYTQNAGAHEEPSEAHLEARQRALNALEGLFQEEETRRANRKKRDHRLKKQAALAKKGKGKKPKPSMAGAKQQPNVEAPSPTGAPTRPQSPLIAGLSPEMETLALDEQTGFALQVSPALREKQPDLIHDMQNLVQEFFAGEDRA